MSYFSFCLVLAWSYGGGISKYPENAVFLWLSDFVFLDDFAVLIPHVFFVLHLYGFEAHVEAFHGVSEGTDGDEIDPALGIVTEGGVGDST